MTLRNSTSLSVVLLFSLSTLSLAANRAGAGGVPEEVKAQALVNYAKLPLSFEENRGQSDARVKFLSHGSDYSILLAPSEVLLNLQSAGQARSTVRMGFPGANSSPVMAGGERQSAISSYFIGNDPAKWVTGAPNFARVHYGELYPGIDLVFYGRQGQLEYDFVVAPGADPRAIRLAFDGVDGMRVDGAGDLVVSTAAGQMRQHKPIVYQESGGVRHAIDGRYVLEPHNRIAFEVGGYDARKPLIIDPVLSFATYLGSPGSELNGISAAASEATYPAVAVDAQGNVYVAGYNGGSPAGFTGHPVTLTVPAQVGSGSYVFVVKMNATGTTLLYDVVFGGTISDVAGGIAVDTGGNAYVTGYTQSGNFPTTAGAPQTSLNGLINAFVTEVNATGTALVYSTYLGGSGSFWGRAIAADHSGNAYVTGTASASGSTPFCTACSISSTASAGFLAKVNAGGTTGLAYSTYLPAGIGYGLAVDSNGDAYVTGSTGTASAPAPAQGYVLKVNNAGGTSGGYGPVLLGNTGATLQTVGFGIALDAQNDAYVTGMTSDPGFPQIMSAAQSTYGGGLYDGFALKLNSSGGLVYGTYIGGLGSSFIPERGSAIGVDAEGNAYVSGTTQCIGFPTVNPISGARNGGPAVLMEGTVSGSSSTWLPTTLAGSFDQVTALAFDSIGNFYAGTGAVNATGGGVYKLAGGVWTSASSGITSTTIDAIAADPNTPATVYAAGSGHLYKTTTGGTSWTQLAQGVGTSAAIAIAKTSSSTSTVYVGSSSGLIYSTSAGSSWSSPAVPWTGAVYALVVDPSSASQMAAYAGTNTGVYQTTNGGGTWGAFNTGLPGIPVTSLAINSLTGTIYAATGNGLFYTTTASANWTQANLGAAAGTPSLVAVDAGNNVYVAFEGAGMATGTNGGTDPSDWSGITYNGLTQNQILALAVQPTGSGAYAGIVSATTAFLTQISPSGQSFLLSTCIGGSDNNLGQSIAVTPGGAVYLSGATKATNFPATPGALQTANAGLYDDFVVGIDVPATHQPELVLQNQQSNGVSVWLMTGANGTVIQESPIITTAAPNWSVVGTADFNNDGVPDILLQNQVTNQISVWYMSAGLTIMSSPIVGQPAPGWKVVGMGDFNRDGYVDLLLQNSSTNALSIWYLGPNFTVLYTSDVATPLTNWHVVGVADFNGDGSPDILLQNQVTNQVSIWYMSGADGTTILSSPVIATALAGWKIVGASDFNNDGVPDIVLQNQSTNQVSVWYMGGSQGATIISSPVIATAAPNWSMLGAGNTQPPPTSQPRLFLQNQQSNAVSKWEMGGTSGTVIEESPIITTATPNWRVVATADFNNDGVPDILLQNQVTNQISVWYMGGTDGLTITTSPIVGQPLSGWEVVGAADFNHDGNADLLLQNTSSNALSIWYLGPNFTVLSAPIVATPLPNWHVVGIADFDQNGSPDFLLQNLVTNQVSIWYLTGSEGTTVLSAPIIATAAANWNVVGASDFNDDGVPDIVLQNQVTNQVSVWYMGAAQGDPPQAQTYTSAPIIQTAAPGWSVVAVR